ncbi:hypothetical protein [Cupriavidus sp. BIC8F]|uniref:hypothetical protein n=1 Tax=Cupriavidus sp. BIC8F TaxID=3079014 RepID=UPI002915D171|nr:hypothetical protein [Cupriavidus sp. BIC8F]
MTLHRTPQNAPAVPAQRPGQCVAYGCPMWAEVKTGPDWTCCCHAFAPPSAWQDITHRLNQRRPLLRTIHRALHVNSADWKPDVAAGYMGKIGRPDLAPARVTLKHLKRDRFTGQTVEVAIERDERDHPQLWVARLLRTLVRECAEGAPEPAKPVATAAVPMPTAVRDLIPNFGGDGR